jgi:hypothetical protein
MFIGGLWKPMREFSALFCKRVCRFISLDVYMCFDFSNEGGLDTKAEHMGN